MAVVIRIVGLVSGRPTPFDGQFVKEYDPNRDGCDPDGNPMTCHLVTVPRTEDAEQFDAPADAYALYTEIDERDPYGGRIDPTDGRMNRPLTAFTVTFLPADTGEGVR